MNQIDLSGRNAVVTGGARGIGYAIAQRLLQSGASVSVWDVDPEAAAEAKQARADSTASAKVCFIRHALRFCARTYLTRALTTAFRRPQGL